MSIVCLGNISDKSSCWEQPQTSPPSLHSLIYMKLLLMVLDYRVHTAALLWFFFFKNIFKPSLELNVIHTQRDDHTFHLCTGTQAHTHLLSLSLHLSFSLHLRVPVRECVCVFAVSFAKRCLIESSVVSNDPSSFLLFYVDQRLKLLWGGGFFFLPSFAKAINWGEIAV